MSLDGHMQWSRRLRGYTRKIIFKPVMRIDVHYTRIDTLKKIARLCEEMLGAGVWIVRSLSHARTKTHFKWVRLARVVVRTSGDRYSSIISEAWRLKRYKFFRESVDRSTTLRTSSSSVLSALLMIFQTISLYIFQYNNPNHNELTNKIKNMFIGGNKIERYGF